jgi:predicted  nucleic acid-binding Zn-ribbon protein
MLKNWFLLASVSCGVGFGSTFLISRNIQQSTWAGLGTVPAVAASMTILSRQRKQEIERQVATTRSSLDDVRQQLQLSESSYREIGSQEQELQAVCTQLRQEVARYSATKWELESTIANLKNQWDSSLAEIAERELYLEDIKQHISRLKGEQNRNSIVVVELNKSLSEKQALLQELELNLSEIRAKREIAIDSAQQSELTLANIHEEITKHYVNKENLEAEIAALENRGKNLQAEIVAQKVEHIKSQQQLAVLKQQQEQISIAVDGLDRSVKDRQSLSNELDLEICNRRQIKEDINSQIKELEESILLVSGHEVDEVLDIGVTKLYQQWQAFNLQLSELKEQISQLTQQQELIQAKRWEDNPIFENNPHLQVLAHIDRHEAITELEVNHILGNSRKSRQFATKLRDYLPHLPFSVRVETSNSGNRYVKAIITIVKPQNLSDVLQPDVAEIELPHSQTAGSMLALEDLVIQDSAFDLGSQSNDDSIERIINTYNTCRSCGNAPIRGQDYCYRCN